MVLTDCDSKIAIEAFLIKIFIFYKGLRFIKDIPDDLKNQLIKQLKYFDPVVLSDIATKILSERCDVDDAADLMEKLKEKEIRFFFQELQLETNFNGVVVWMRKSFPAGSTGMQPNVT